MSSAARKAEEVAKKVKRDQEAFAAKRAALEQRLERGLEFQVDDDSGTGQRDPTKAPDSGYGLMTKAEFAALHEKDKESDKVGEKRRREEGVGGGRGEGAGGEGKRRKKVISLSFGEDEDGEGGGEEVIVLKKKKKKGLKGEYLPDTTRKVREAGLKDKFAKEWAAEEEALKKEKMEVVYSYWDGSGHRRTMKVPRGASIGRFLRWVHEDLLPEFPELGSTPPEDLIFVKEDLMLPATVTFHELIALGVKGRTGRRKLFEHLTTGGEDEHPGKIVDRRWFERNKHIFPASQWEPLNLAKLTPQPQNSHS